MNRLILGLVFVIVAVAFSPGDRISWPFIQWRVYVDPAATPEWIESPVISWQDKSGVVDTVYAADLFTPVEVRMSERVLRGAFDVVAGRPESTSTSEAYRATIARRLKLKPGTRVVGMNFRWRPDLEARRPLHRRAPDEVHHLGDFIVTGEADS